MTYNPSADTKRYPDSDREFKSAIRAALPSFLREQRPIRGLLFGVLFSIATGALLGFCINKSGLIIPVINGFIIGCVVGSMMTIMGHIYERKWRWYAVGLSIFGYVLASLVGAFLLSNAYSEPVSITIAKRSLASPEFNAGYLGVTPLDIVGMAFAGCTAYHYAKRRITRGQFIKRAIELKDAEHMPPAWTPEDGRR